MRWGPKRNRTRWRDDLAQTSWQDFERLLARHYREEGYEVEHCGTASTGTRFDGGVDLVLRREGETVLVQCKHWNAAQVPHNDVHQLLGLLETRQAQRAVLVTSGEFTAAAKNAASRTPRIELIDGVALRQMVDPRLIPASQASPMTSGPDPDSRQGWAGSFKEGRAGGHWRKKRRQTPEEVFREVGIKVLFLFVAIVLVVMAFRSVSQNLQSRLAPASFGPTTESGPPRSAATTPRATPSVEAPISKRSESMTPEQLEEWEKKNAEAMEILERTTPSVDD